MHTCEDDDDDDDDDDNDDDDVDSVSEQQVVEQVKDLQQELNPDDDDDQILKELSMPGVEGNTEDVSDKSDYGSDDEMEQFSQQNHLHRPHRETIPDHQANDSDKKAIVLDPVIVRKHVKRTLIKKQKFQYRQPPPPQRGNRKVRKQHSKRKQILNYFEDF